MGERRGAWAIGVAVAVGLTAGIGAYTFRYAEGLSYFSTDPKACVNCHIMRPQYDGWQKASHHAVAVCIDCHLPHDFVPKYLAKAENGWRHGEKFTTQSFQEPIFVQARGGEILQDNCLRCHGPLVDELARKSGTDDPHAGLSKADVDAQFDSYFPLIIRGSIAVQITLELGIATDLKTQLLFQQPLELVGMSWFTDWSEQLFFGTEPITGICCLVPLGICRVTDRYKTMHSDIAQAGQLFLQTVRCRN